MPSEDNNALYFSRVMTLGVLLLVLIFALGLILYVYTSGGVDSAIYIG